MVQDTLTGAFRISNPKTRIPEHVVMNIMAKLRRPLASFTPTGEEHTGMDVISSAFPLMNFNERVTIENGRLTKGLLKKGAFNTTSEGVLHVLFNDFGPQRCGQFINEVQSIVTKFNMYTGFSTGASDLVSNAETVDFVAATLAEGRRRVQEILTDVHAGRFVNISGRTDGEELENQINNTLKDISAKITDRVSETLPRENRLVQMVESGAKGSSLNITQMIALLGQQIIDGKRVQYTLKDRSLPHFTKFDDGIESRGFVESSFVQGLRPAEYFFHAMGGREGLIDTAVKTSDTGYIQRQMMKTMEDMHAAYDGTVRNNTGVIIQYRYGEDGVDSTQVESQPIDLALLTLEEIYRRYALTPADVAAVSDAADGSQPPDLVDEIVKDRDMLVNEVFSHNKKSGVLAPVHLKRLIDGYRNPYSTKTDLTAAYVVEELTKLIKEPYMVQNRLFHCLLRFYLAPRRCILEYRMTQKIFDEVVKDVRYRYIKSLVHPGEMVGALAAQSIGEPTTQLTLNSVDWDERIVIAKNGRVMTPQIGEFVDAYCAENAGKVQHLDNDQKYAEMNDDDWMALSCDENGRMMWTKLEAVTHHPVVNEDGSSTILEVETESGRTIKATKGKSFLTVVDGKLTATNGSELRVGDELPVAASLAISELPEIAEFSLRSLLPASEWLYGTDALKALEIMNRENAAGNKYWFKAHAGKDFVIPYTRSDAFRDAFLNGHNTYAAEFKAGFVYQKFHTTSPSQIPETWELTKELGFFVGAYLAEGMSNRTQVMITNNDDGYIQRVRTLMDAWSVGTHVVSGEKHAENTGIRGHTQSLIIHSTMLAKVMGELFGKTSHVKDIPDWVLQAPDAFVKSLVDGYISGDGCVTLRDTLTYSSASENLITKLNLLMARYGVFTTTSKRMPDIGKFKSVHTQYSAYIPVHYATVFARQFKLSIAKKQERLDAIAAGGERAFRRTVMSETVLDKIKSIREILPIKGRVYDLTVAKTRNFMVANLMCQRDTFHSAGTVKAGATQGVPRIKELLGVSRNPKKPLCFAYLAPELSTNLDHAIMMIREIQQTTVRDITKSVRMYYDPYPLTTDTKVAEDREILQSYQAFSATNARDCVSPWIMRLEFDETAMASRSIQDMVAIQDALIAQGDVARCVYSDTNADKLMMRIVFSPDVVKNMLTLRYMEERILDVVISGVDGVQGVYQRDVNKEMTWDDSINGYVSKKQHVLDVEGSGILYSLLAFPNVDPTRTFSNDIHEVMDVFGIEAARQALYDEFWEVLSAAYVNYHHMSVLLDAMTYQGRLVSVDRFGMGKHDNGVLAKSSFEETSRILFNAAVSSEFDPMKGVSANIMFGQKAPCGTGMVEILLDETRLPEGEEEIFQDYREQQPSAPAPVSDSGTECRVEDINMW